MSEVQHVQLTPTQRIHEICNRMHQNMSASAINLARADLRRVADAVKQLEITLAEIYRNEQESAALADPQPVAVVVQFPERRRVVPIQSGGAA